MIGYLTGGNMRPYALALGLKSLKQNLRRNLATGFAIGIGYIAMLFVLGYGTRIDRYLGTATVFLQQSGHVAVYKKGGLRRHLVKPRSYSLSPKDVQAISDILKRRSDFDFASPYLISGGLAGNGCTSFPFIGRGFDPEMQERIMTHETVRTIIPEFQSVLKGKPIWTSGNGNQVSLAKGLSKRMGKGLREDVSGETVFLNPADCNSPKASELLRKDASVQILGRTFDGRGGAADAEFTSEYSTGLSITEDSALQTPLAFMQNLLDTDKVSYLAIFLKDPSHAEEVARSLRAEMKKLKMPVDAFAYSDIRLNPSYVQGKSVMTFTVVFVSLIVIGVALLSILNTLSIGLAESRRQIGTLLAIGYNPEEIAWIYTVEAIATSLIALLIGAAASLGICSLVNGLGIPLQAPGFSHSTTFQVTPTPLHYFIVYVLLAILASLSTFVMAKRYAARPILNLLDRGG